MEVSDETIVMLKCAAISKFGYKPSKRVIQEFLASYTAGKALDGNIESLVKPFIEYVGLHCRHTVTDDSDRIRATFLAFDLRGQGCISRADLIFVAKKIVPHMKESYINHIFRQIDTDNDGYVTYKEFERLMMFDASNGS